MAENSDHNDFYVGWASRIPQAVRKTLRISLIVLLALMLSMTWFIATHQKEFPNSRFEYGTQTELEGVLYRSPVPILKVNYGNDASGEPVIQSVLLINFLKFGADDLLDTYEERMGTLSGTKVKVRGTLIYYDGVTMLELTDKENALIEFTEYSSPNPQRKDLGDMSFIGEIVDSKCYFGSMKPGYGKAHRACAVRCISGGIPPVLAVSNEEGEMTYLLMVGPKGEPINKTVLPFVGDLISIHGRVEQIDDWLVLYTNPASDISVIAEQEDEETTVSVMHETSLTLCR